MSIAYNTNIIRDGLVLHLDAANVKSYPGSGTTWYDLSGNGNHGTVSSGEFVAPGYFQNLGNTSNFFTVSVGDSTSINGAFSTVVGGWTIEELIWTNSVTYPEADAGSVVSTTAYGTSATGFDWNHGITNSSFQFGVTSGGASVDYDKRVTITLNPPFDALNTWKMRSMIWDRSANTVSLYINGVYQGGGTIAEVQGQPLYDGSGIVFGSLYGWKHYGRRSVIRAYSRVLTSSEIIQNFESIRGRCGL